MRKRLSKQQASARYSTEVWRDCSMFSCSRVEPARQSCDRTVTEVQHLCVTGRLRYHFRITVPSMAIANAEHDDSHALRPKVI